MVANLSFSRFSHPGPSLSQVKAQLQSSERRDAAEDAATDVATKGRVAFLALGFWLEDAW